MNRVRAAFLAAGVLVAALVAAGTSTSTARSNAGRAAPSFDGASLVVSRWAGDPWQAATTSDAAAWAKLTGGAASIDALPYENLQQKQVLTLSSGSDYDIVYVHPSWFGQYAKAGYLAPIGQYLKNPDLAAGGSGSSTFLPNILKQGAYQGQQYCLQDFVGTDLLAYRTDLFKASRLPAPSTTDAVLTAARTLNGKNGVAGIVLPGKRTGAVADLMSTLLAGLGTWWYSPAGKSTLDVAKATRAVAFYAEAAKYAPKGVLNFHVDEAATLAAQGKAAMVIVNTPSFARLNDPKQSKTVGKWAYVPLAMRAGHPGGELIYWNWCVSAKSSNPEAAYSLIRYLTAKRQQAAVATTAYTAGATSDFYGDKALTRKLAFLPAMNAALAHSQPQPSIAAWPKLQNTIELAVQDAIGGKKTPQQAAKAMRAALDAALRG
jgi:ABC-type glycerol-3-phosphate transport system substrate-binding protein